MEKAHGVWVGMEDAVLRISEAINVCESLVYARVPWQARGK